MFGVRPGTALWPTAGGAIGLDNGIRPVDTGSEYHGVGFTTFACVRFRTYRTPSYLRVGSTVIERSTRTAARVSGIGLEFVRTCRLKLDDFVMERWWVLVSRLDLYYSRAGQYLEMCSTGIKFLL